MNVLKEKTSQLDIHASSHLPGLGNDAGQVEYDSSSAFSPMCWHRSQKSSAGREDTRSKRNKLYLPPTNTISEFCNKPQLGKKYYLV